MTTLYFLLYALTTAILLVVMVIRRHKTTNKQTKGKRMKTINFVFEKTTKNTVKFNEVPPPGEPHVIGSLYLQKWFVGEAKTVTVTVDLPAKPEKLNEYK